jgi:hypothetical protein
MVTTSSGPIIGVSTKSSHIEAARKTILDKEERLLGAFHGKPLRGGKPIVVFAGHHYLLITDRRVIFWGSGLVSGSVDAFAYSDISSVDAHRGLLFGDIVLNVKGAKQKFRSMRKGDVQIAVKLIREKKKADLLARI